MKLQAREYCNIPYRYTFIYSFLQQYCFHHKRPLGDTRSDKGAFLLRGGLKQYYGMSWSATHFINLCADGQAANEIMSLILEDISICIIKGINSINEWGKKRFVYLGSVSQIID